MMPCDVGFSKRELASPLIFYLSECGSIFQGAEVRPW